MLSSDGFDLAWNQYQGHLVDRLNKLTAGIPSFAPIYSIGTSITSITNTINQTLRPSTLIQKISSLPTPVNPTPPPSSITPVWPGQTTISSPPSPPTLPKCPPPSQPKSATLSPPPTHSEPPSSRLPMPCLAPASSGSSDTKTGTHT